MINYPVPNIILSSCLEHEFCRYDGNMISSEIICILKPFVNFITVCPEVEIGLGIPRDTITLIDSNNDSTFIQPATNKNLTTQMMQFSMDFANNHTALDGILLKSKSPSCGITDAKIYRGLQQSILRNGSGLFAHQLVQANPHVPAEDEKRLTNAKIRTIYFTRIFILARFRTMQISTMAELIQFQSNNKLLFMTFSQKHLRELGKIAANHHKYSVAKVIHEYRQSFYQLLLRSPRYTSHLNTLDHAIGYFSHYLTSAEKKHYGQLKQYYRTHKIDLSPLLLLMQSWIERFDIEYLRQQSYFYPYPPELMGCPDSDKGHVQ